MGLAVAARIVYSLTIGRHLKLGLDSIGYLLLGSSLANGHGYSNPALFLSGIHKPTANWVPGYPIFLAGLYKLGITSPTGFRIAGSLCGGVGVLLTGLFGRRVSGRAAVGLLAAGLVALSPALIAADGSLMSETIAVPLTVGVLLAAAWAGDSTSLRRWVVAGALAGLLVLVRSEDLLIALLLIPLAILVAPSVDIGRRAAQLACALLAAAVVVSPWVIRNYVTFTPRVLLSTNAGKTVAGANCPLTYEGPLIGYWDDACVGHSQLASSDEAEYNALTKTEGLDYARSHLSRVPLVVGVRILRAWGLYNPLQEARLASSQTRSIGWQQVAWPVSLLVLIMAIPGVIWLRKDRLALVLLAGPAVIATFVVASTFGNTRYVLGAVPPLCVGAAITVVTVIDRRRDAPDRRRRTGRPSS